MMANTSAGELIRQVAAQFDGADLYFGHGTDNAVDEAAALVFHVLALDHAAGAEVYQTQATAVQAAQIERLAAQRIETREPLAYLTGEAWFAGLPFAVDANVLVPRSPIAELIEQEFAPWLAPKRVGRVLEIGTGSGCIAIACARQFPAAEVVATDISAAALRLAELNARRHDVANRLTLVETDHAAGVRGPFDLLVSNPPYVPSGEMHDLPPEYGREPALGLVSGSDGLDSARRILQDAPGLLAPHGVLVLEVGAQWRALEAAYPDLPFTWLEFARGGEGVCVIEAAALSGGTDRG